MTGSNRTSKIANRHSPVWRIFHFGPRFEMVGYVRQGGLDYVRMFVTATAKDKSNESTEFLGQLAELEHYYPEQRDAYEGRFWRLCRLTAPQEDWLRGYLVDADQKPLTIAKLGARLHLSPQVMKQTLLALKRVGLIEQVDCPAFVKPDRDVDAGQGGDQGQGRGKGRGGRKKAGRGKSKAKASARAAAGEISKHFETFGKTKKAFKENQIQSEVESKDQPKEILGLSSSDPTPNQAKGESPLPNHTEGPRATRTALAPTTAPPMNPTISDAGGTGRVVPFAGPPGSVEQSAARLRRQYANPVKAMARMIYEALGAPWPEGSKEESQDMGAFENAVKRLHASGVPPPEAARLWESLVKEARRLRKIYRDRGGYQSAKKVWFHPVFRDKLAKRVAARM